MKNWKLIIVVVLAIAVGLGFLFKAQFTSKDIYESVQPTMSNFVLKVKSSGMVTPKNKVVIPSPISGRIDQVLVEEGAKVKKGQVLAIMSSADRVALMDSLHAEVTEEEKAQVLSMYRPIQVLAPASGTIVKRSIDKGQSVSPQNTLFEISDVLIVLSKVDETDIAKVKLGQEVEVVVDAYPGEQFPGVVDRIGQQSTVTNNVTTYEVFIHLSGQLPDSIKSGMSASVAYIVMKKDNILTLPSWLTEGRRNTSFQVQIKNGSQKLISKEIQIGESNGELVEVLSGLELNEVVYYKPLSYEQDQKEAPFSVMGRKKK